MSDSYTGVRVVDVRPELVHLLYTEKEIGVDFDQRRKFSQNEYVVIKGPEQGQSAITRCKGDRLVLVNSDGLSAGGIRPKNKEQRMALDALLDDTVGVVALTGRAGTGKTLLSLAAAIQKIEDKVYDRIIITRPMSQVGKRDLGILPGDINEKFNPYLMNYMCNIEQIIKFDKKSRTKITDINDVFDRYNIQVVPLQVIRGASFVNTFIIADETQVLDYHEMATLGTRVGEGSKLVILGDLNQRDEKIAIPSTGLYKFINNEKAMASPLVASIELLKCERGPIATLFADVFEV